ncbi:DODA-type extradiol aromatic ring-opening family dioxygenase [Duganella radicis]|uniref:Dioxygenase n=1 Tax=Duganella radicis TaxID=551988 RepID=A0A6L6PDX7_9BURK|nr:class III extradiol ring-cleavage dioxygenase [Duganella radicis]MTV37204.1 dioxygenase [Duganella radicis]
MELLPSLYISHGAPTYALESGIAGNHLAALGRALQRPRAMLVVSPHWMTPVLRVTMSARPPTIHDFGGFPRALYELEYPASGHPELAACTLNVLRAAGYRAEGDTVRGLDHGVWVPLMHLYPQADVPVLQLSMPARLDADAAFALGQALRPLAAEGVLIIGSGSLTHNLDDYYNQHGRDEDYVVEFAAWIAAAVAAGDQDKLRRAMAIAPHARRAHPTPEHYWPLLIAAGAAPNFLPVTVLEGGISHGMLAMDSFLFGQAISPSTSYPDGV